MKTYLPEGDELPDDWVQSLDPSEAAFIKLVDEQAHELQAVKDVLVASLNALDSQRDAIIATQAMVEDIFIRTMDDDF